jgi:hypothetical protein
MSPTVADEPCFRTVYQLGADWLWFFLVVMAGLLLAAWVGELAVEAIHVAPGASG